MEFFLPSGRIHLLFFQSIPPLIEPIDYIWGSEDDTGCTGRRRELISSELNDLYINVWLISVFLFEFLIGFPHHKPPIEPIPPSTLRHPSNQTTQPQMTSNGKPIETCSTLYLIYNNYHPTSLLEIHLPHLLCGTNPQLNWMAQRMLLINCTNLYYWTALQCDYRRRERFVRRSFDRHNTRHKSHSSTYRFLSPLSLSLTHQWARVQSIKRRPVIRFWSFTFWYFIPINL